LKFRFVVRVERGWKEGGKRVERGWKEGGKREDKRGRREGRGMKNQV
jgi:hypothetical protein